MISLKCLSFLHISSYLQKQARSVIAVISYGNDSFKKKCLGLQTWVLFGRFFCASLHFSLSVSEIVYIYINIYIQRGQKETVTFLLFILL